VNNNIIELTGLTKKYRSFTAVNNLSLSIRKGEIFGLLGPNGAGKSTTILMMLGLTEPTSGEVRVCGVDPVTRPIEVKKKVGYLPEDVGFYYHRSGLENLVFTARLNLFTEKEATRKARELLDRVGLQDASDKITGKYSRGMLQRLGLADVLIKNPEVIILDEPTLGIDPKGVKEFLNLIVGLSREENITVLFSSHDLYQVQQVCDRVGLFVSGKLIALGDIRTLSDKLFSHGSINIEVRVSRPERTGSGAESDITTERWLKDKLSSTEGVLSVRKENDLYQIECSMDLSAEIARTIIGSGADLYYLNKKEYGLNDIYYRYFEGGEDHE